MGGKIHEKSISFSGYLYKKPDREFKYVAIGILTKFEKRLTIEDFDQIKELSLIEPWWDTIGSIAPSI